MMRRCILSECKNSKNGWDASYHRFPKDPTIRDKWLQNLNLEGVKITSKKFLCSEHFHKEDLGLRSTLYKGAMPFRENYVQIHKSQLVESRLKVLGKQNDKIREPREDSSDVGKKRKFGNQITKSIEQCAVTSSDGTYTSKKLRIIRSRGECTENWRSVDSTKTTTATFHNRNLEPKNVDLNCGDDGSDDEIYEELYLDDETSSNVDYDVEDESKCSIDVLDEYYIEVNDGTSINGYMSYDNYNENEQQNSVKFVYDDDNEEHFKLEAIEICPVTEEDP